MVDSSQRVGSVLEHTQRVDSIERLRSQGQVEQVSPQHQIIISTKSSKCATTGPGRGGEINCHDFGAALESNLRESAGPAAGVEQHLSLNLIRRPTRFSKEAISRCRFGRTGIELNFSEAKPLRGEILAVVVALRLDEIKHPFCHAARRSLQKIRERAEGVCSVVEFEQNYLCYTAAALGATCRVIVAPAPVGLTVLVARMALCLVASYNPSSSRVALIELPQIC